MGLIKEQRKEQRKEGRKKERKKERKEGRKEGAPQLEFLDSALGLPPIRA